MFLILRACLMLSHKIPHLGHLEKTILRVLISVLQSNEEKIILGQIRLVENLMYIYVISKNYAMLDSRQTRSRQATAYHKKQFDIDNM